MDDALKPDTPPPPLVSADWLKQHIQDRRVKVIDASWRMPGDGAAIDAFRERHIPGAMFLDIDAVADKSTDLPHMLPTPAAFAEWAGGAGISADDLVVVYDDKGMFSAPRAWWTFRAMGHRQVRVLDGGLDAWNNAGGALESGAEPPIATTYIPDPRMSLVVGADRVRQALAEGALVLDARPAPRFAGEVSEPRPGLRCGAMPGAINIPFAAVTREGARLESAQTLRDRLPAPRANEPLIATCGSGVTAAVLALAYAAIGHEDVAVYDGSWAEWGRVSANPTLFPCTTDGC